MARAPWQGPAEVLGNSLKTPPSWDPSDEERYPFRHWLADLTLWSAATELGVPQQAPAVVLRLGGAARLLARDIPVGQLQNGAVVDLNDGNGQQHVTGMALLMIILGRAFSPLPEESSLRAINDMLAFTRHGSENVDGGAGPVHCCPVSGTHTR